MNLQHFLEALWPQVLETLDTMADSGWSRESSVRAVASMIDDLLPCETLVPGPAGAALEAVDGAIVRALLDLASHAVWKDPEARNARRSKRQRVRDALRSGKVEVPRA